MTQVMVHSEVHPKVHFGAKFDVPFSYSRQWQMSPILRFAQ